jgi:hypothetical protein
MVTPTLSVDGAQLRVSPVGVMFEATGLPGVVGGSWSAGGSVEAVTLPENEEKLLAASNARTCRVQVDRAGRSVMVIELVGVRQALIGAVEPGGTTVCTSYPVTPTLSDDGAHRSVNPLDVGSDATGVPGVLGGIVSTATSSTMLMLSNDADASVVAKPTRLPNVADPRPDTATCAPGPVPAAMTPMRPGKLRSMVSRCHVPTAAA